MAEVISSNFSGNSTDSGKNNSRIIIVAVLALVAVLATTLYFKDRQSNPPAVGEEQLINGDSGAVVDEDRAAVGGGQYQDGSYEATGNYLSPGGQESIRVELTLENGVVTTAEVESLATRPESQEFQGQFVDNYQAQVLGRNIDELSLDKVAGSSLTPKGFNDALEKIKREAST